MNMDRRGMALILLVLLLSNGAQSSQPHNIESRSLKVPWQDELCCDSPAAANRTSSESRPLQFSQCNFRSRQQQTPSSNGLCVDVMCRIRDNWRSLTCELHSDQTVFSTTPGTISLQPVLWEGVSFSDDPVTCEGGSSSLNCSLLLGSSSSDVTLNISIAHVAASPVHLHLPPTPVKPSAPVNVSHHQTIEAELVLDWDNPPEESGPLRYEVRHSSNVTETSWMVFHVFGDQRLLLDVEVNVNYTIQVRSSVIVNPPLWSDWSEPHHIRLEPVSYIPEIVKVRPGENVTIHCVFNDHDYNSSSAVWILNYEEPLDNSQYQSVNQWVSQVTVRPSVTTMYDMLLCSQENALIYSQIYVEGASINITCQTNGNINAMDCSWENKEPTNPKFLSRWSDVACDEMEWRERAGEELGQPGPMCTNQRSCRIQPLRMNCYRLWLQMDSPLGPINSRPVYVSPIEHVKPHTASHIEAVTRSSGVLAVSWRAPPLPVQGVRCQLRFHAPTSVGHPEWRIQPPVLVREDKVPVPDMCLSYAVQVRCLPLHGSGYWSDWSQTVYSVPQNSSAPERGPDFWRILSKNPNGNRTTVTLLFEHLQTSGLSHCVDGLIVRHQPQSGTVREERIGLKSSHRFEWSGEVHSVTVKTYNRMGPSKNNFNMTLSAQVKRATVRSFHVLLINSSCVSVSWSLLDHSPVPDFMVLQWTPRSLQDTQAHKGSSTWRRLVYTDCPLHVRGEFFSSEEYDFYLFPVFADCEGQPVHTRAVRREPAAYMLLMIISFLSVVLLVTLILTQNQMKKIIWKEVPNPKKCSWAKGLDLRKVDILEDLLRAPETLPSWPLLLPAENISTVVIMDKSDLPPPPSPPPPPLAQPSFVSFASEPSSSRDSTELLNPEVDALLPPAPHSGQSSVTYSTVLLLDPKLKQRSGDSSSDEGNFSANNSDISDSSHSSALWELESCRDTDNRRSCSYISAEELSESSDEVEDENKRGKDLYYLKLNGAESDEERDDGGDNLWKSIVLSKEDCPCSLLDSEDSNERSVLLTAPPCGVSPLYLPQYRTAHSNTTPQL